MSLTHKSPNFSKGRQGQRPHTIVIHVMDRTLRGTDFWFKDPYSGVSAHYGVGRGGEVHSYVLESDTAWHADKMDKKPLWKNAPGDVINPNLVTIGIEFEGNSRSVWTKKQKEAGGKLIAEICKRWNIPTNRDFVIGHYEVSMIRRPNCPAYKQDAIGIIPELIEIARKK